MLRHISARSLFTTGIKRALSIFSVAVLVLSILPITAVSAATFKPNIVYIAGSSSGGNSALRATDINSPSFSSNLQLYTGYPRLGYPDVNHAGTKVYYTIPTTGTPVYEVNADGTGNRLVATNCSMPAVSPDDMKLICTGSVAGTTTIKIVSIADGTYTTVNMVHPSAGMSVNNGVDWVDSDTIVFLAEVYSGSYFEGCTRQTLVVARMDLNGSNFQKLSPCDGVSASRPHTSADGTKVAYTRNVSSVWTVNSDGSNGHLLAAPPAGYYYDYPMWSPDGGALLVTARRLYPNQDLNSRLLVLSTSTGSILTAMEQQYSNTFNEAAWLTSYVPSDTTPPVVSGTPNRQPDGIENWYRADATINWTSTDPEPSSGAPTQPPATIADQEGEHTYTSSPSCDPKNNCTTGSLPLKIDKTAPALGTPTWSVAPKAVNESTALTVPVSDTTSGVFGGEYFIGETDPGQGNGAAMTISGTNLATSFGTDFTPGTYKVNVRAKDKAGNWSAVTSTNLEVYEPDTVAPIVTPNTDRAANGNDWYNGDVTITWSVVDPDPSSGIPTQPAPTIANQEGTHTYTSEPSCDPVGNCATGNKVLNIDKTAPSITPSLSQAPNAAGWNNAPVTVTFDCSDATSGVDTCSAPVLVDEEGVTVVTGAAVDKAGNIKEVNIFISLDMTAPTISPTVTPVPTTGIWNKTDVTVSYACDDALSGVATCSGPVTLIGDGAAQTATGTVTDIAGNTASVMAGPINIDKTSPTITPSLSQAPNAAGWNNTPVTVTFDCGDATSGVASCTEPVTVTAEGGTIVTGTAVDGAGNVSEVNVFVFVDSSLPDITSSASPAANSLGWNNTDVTVNFNCSDAVSGIASCSSSTTLTSEGTNQVVTGTATDSADNTNTTNRTVNIDKTAPTLGAFTWQTNPKAVLAASQLSVAATDDLSGITEAEYFIGDTDPGVGNGATMAVGGSTLTTTFGSDFPTGVYKISVRAKDAADNWSTVGSSYLVVYDPSGPRITGKSYSDFIPTLAGGDILPNLLATSNAIGDFGFSVKYNNAGQIDATSDLQFSYDVTDGGVECKKSKKTEICHIFDLNATNIEWLVVQDQNNSRGVFQGSATLNVDGVISQVEFRLTGIDRDRVSGTLDNFELQIFVGGADPNTATPLYRIHPTDLDHRTIDII